MSAFRVVIPARYGATRLPGKPLRPLLGRPLVAHVADRGLEAGADEVIVAADDERVCEALADSRAVTVLTSSDHASGTDRIAEVARSRGWDEGDIVVNLQGDEPAVDPGLIRRVAASLDENRDAEMSTAATPIREPGPLFDPTVVKVVTGDSGLACYFSRAPIPWVRGAFEWGRVPGALPRGVTFLRHIGLYGYRVGALRRICAESPRPNEEAESLEQLRALALGIDIHITVVDAHDGYGVDTEADLARAEEALGRPTELQSLE